MKKFLEFLLTLLRRRAGSVTAPYPSTLRFAGDSPPKVLIIGDSWADISGLEHGLAEILGGSVIYGYSGHTAGQIAARLEAADAAYLAGSLGRLPVAVFLVGVNDAYLHVGPKAYGQAVHALRKIGARLADRVFVVQVPRVNMWAPERWWGSRAKRFALRWIFHFGKRDATDAYRQAAAPEITYDDFIYGFAGHEHNYADDGLHLLPERYVDLGRHIGKQVKHLTS